ncbi:MULTISPECIES: hypothetical protein [unclassified Roseateles]|uniref:hypothetical protein n=1 Tax=unclassified Roseateles TaxID=2626991 RepID=UPI0012E3E528|nr:MULTISPECIES: hypothetical protein [unclassified Roseateles]
MIRIDAMWLTALTEFGIEVVKLESSLTAPDPENGRHLRTRRDQMGHLADWFD